MHITVQCRVCIPLLAPHRAGSGPCHPQDTVLCTLPTHQNPPQVPDIAQCLSSPTSKKFAIFLSWPHRVSSICDIVTDNHQELADDRQEHRQFSKHYQIAILETCEPLTRVMSCSNLLHALFSLSLAKSTGPLVTSNFWDNLDL